MRPRDPNGMAAYIFFRLNYGSWSHQAAVFVAHGLARIVHGRAMVPTDAGAVLFERALVKELHESIKTGG